VARAHLLDKSGSKFDPACEALLSRWDDLMAISTAQAAAPPHAAQSVAASGFGNVRRPILNLLIVWRVVPARVGMPGKGAFPKPARNAMPKSPAQCSEGWRRPNGCKSGRRQERKKE
jgi:hypothetical protein